MQNDPKTARHDADANIQWTQAAKAYAVCFKTLPALLGVPATTSKSKTVSIAELAEATASSEVWVRDCLAGKDEAVSGQRAAAILGLPNNSDFLHIFIRPKATLRKGHRYSLLELKSVRKKVFKREPLHGSGLPADPLCEGSL